MPEINDWDTTAANNNSAPPHGWPESMDYEDVNDSARENMAVLARWHKDTNGSLVSSGSANAYAVTANQALTAYYDGLSLVFEANHTNTGAATLDVDTVGAAAIVRLDGSALGAGAIQAGGKYRVIYDGTNWQLLGASLSPTSPETISGNWTFTGFVAFSGDVEMSGQINLGSTPNETIASGAIDYTAGYIILDTEGAAPTDTLTTINGGVEGDFLLIRTASGARVPTVEDGTGNIQMAGNFVMTSPFDMLLLVHNGSTWAEVSRSDNG